MNNDTEPMERKKHAPTSEETRKSGNLGKSSAWAIRRHVQAITTDAVINAYAEMQSKLKDKPLNQAKSEIALQIFSELQKWVLDVPVKERNPYPELSAEERERRAKIGEIGRAKYAEMLKAKKEQKEKELF